MIFFLMIYFSGLSSGIPSTGTIRMGPFTALSWCEIAAKSAERQFEAERYTVDALKVKSEVIP